MSEEKNEERINLRPICAAFNHFELYADGSVALNPAHIAYWIAEPDGSVVIHMATGRAFTLSVDQAKELIGTTQRVLELTQRQMERANSRIEVPTIMH